MGRAKNGDRLHLQPNEMTKNKQNKNKKQKQQQQKTTEQLIGQPSRDSLGKRHNIHARLIVFPVKLTDEEHKQKANKRQHNRGESTNKFTLEKEE